MLVSDKPGEFAIATQNWEMKNILECQMYAARNGMPTLPTIQRLMKINTKKTINFIQLVIMNLCFSLNIGKNMRVDQVQEAAVIIAETFPLLTIQDIVAFTKKAKKGFYGEFYDRVDVVTLTAMLTKYFDERIEAAMKINDEERIRLNDLFKDVSDFDSFWASAGEPGSRDISEWTKTKPEWINALKQKSEQAKNI